MIEWPSFRNDRGTFSYDNPASSFRKQGGFTSYHHGENFIFFIIKKEGVQAEKQVIFKRKIIALIFWNKIIFKNEKSSQKTVRIFIISIGRSYFKIFDRKP